MIDETKHEFTPDDRLSNDELFRHYSAVKARLRALETEIKRRAKDGPIAGAGWTAQLTRTEYNEIPNRELVIPAVIEHFPDQEETTEIDPAAVLQDVLDGLTTSQWLSVLKKLNYRKPLMEAMAAVDDSGNEGMLPEPEYGSERVQIAEDK